MVEYAAIRGEAIAVPAGFGEAEAGDVLMYKSFIPCIYFGDGASQDLWIGLVRFRLRAGGAWRALDADAVLFQQILEIGSLQAGGL